MHRIRPCEAKFEERRAVKKRQRDRIAMIRHQGGKRGEESSGCSVASQIAILRFRRGIQCTRTNRRSERERVLGEEFFGALHDRRFDLFLS